MAKIAVEANPVSNGQASGAPAYRLLASGAGWTVSDVLCSAGPRDRPFEEQHSNVCIAIVVRGSFQYESHAGRELMTPGSLLLGNPGESFECGHEHGRGDRCLSFAYEPPYFESLGAEAGLRRRRFASLRIPPVRQFSRLVARACAGVGEPAASGWWQEIGLELAVQALEICSNQPKQPSLPSAEARVTRVVRMIENRPESDHSLALLAREARLSRYHFLRIFQQLTGLTPHRYILRARLRRAATRLLLDPARVLDVALDSGFGDASNFNHAFRAEFGVSPRSFRTNHEIPRAS